MSALAGRISSATVVTSTNSEGGHMLRSSFSDYTRGFFAARREVFKDIRPRGDDGEYFIDLVYRAIRCGFAVCELPCFAKPRRSGESKTGSNLGQYLRRGRKFLSTVVRLRWEDLCGTDQAIQKAS